MCYACISCLLSQHNIPIQQWYIQTSVITTGMQKDFSNGIHVSYMAGPFILTHSVLTQTLFHINSRGSLGSTEQSWRSKVVELSAFYPPQDTLVVVRFNAFLEIYSTLTICKSGGDATEAIGTERRKDHIKNGRLQAARFSGKTDEGHQG